MRAMTKAVLGAALVGSLSLLSACGNKNDSKNGGRANSVNADGTCSDAFVNDFNVVVTEFDHLRTSGGRADKTPLMNACTNFLNNHGGVVCKASRNGQVAEIDANNVKLACDNLR